MEAIFLFSFLKKKKDETVVMGYRQIHFIAYAWSNPEGFIPGVVYYRNEGNIVNEVGKILHQAPEYTWGGSLQTTESEVLFRAGEFSIATIEKLMALPYKTHMSSPSTDKPVLALP